MHINPSAVIDLYILCELFSRLVALVKDYEQAPTKRLYEADAITQKSSWADVLRSSAQYVKNTHYPRDGVAVHCC